MPPFAYPPPRKLSTATGTPRPAPVAPRPCRGGISLIEVLVSLGVLTLGLLGVAAMFPVGGYYMLTAEVADRGTAIAQAAFSDVVAQGMLNPDEWVAFKPQQMGAATPVNPTRNFAAADGADNKFSRRFRRALDQSLADTRSLPRAARQQALAQQFGHAYVIDPLAVASLSPRSGAVIPMTLPLIHSGSHFPAVDQPNSQNAAAGWNTWGSYWPVRRVTTRSAANSSTLALEAALADHLAASSDDLALDLPEQSETPATQLWATSAGGASQQIPVARQWSGAYSWIATVAPLTAEARDALATGEPSHYYNVSVVVFNRRTVSRSVPATGLLNDMRPAAELLSSAERLVGARVVSTGVSGGELLLEALPVPDSTGEPDNPIVIEDLKAGEWLMLCGPHPLSTIEQPMFVLNWYRIVAIDGEDVQLDDQGNPTSSSGEPVRRLVALRGPQWPWQPAADLTDDTLLSNQLRVGIFAGAVAVHSRTMRLEGNSVWSVNRP